MPSNVTPGNSEPNQVTALVESLFEGVAYKENGPGYREGTSSREKSATLVVERGRMKGLPLLLVDVEQRLKAPLSSDVIVNVRYLLSDTTRVDQRVTYTLPSEAADATVDQKVYFGDTWGREIPYEPFVGKPVEPLEMMRLIIEEVRAARAN
jgi:hypothetical protein